MANKKNEEDLRNKTLQFRVNDEENDIIEQKAKQIGLTVSNYVRMVSMNADVKVTLDINKKEK